MRDLVGMADECGRRSPDCTGGGVPRGGRRGARDRMPPARATPDASGGAPGRPGAPPDASGVARAGGIRSRAPRRPPRGTPPPVQSGDRRPHSSAIPTRSRMTVPTVRYTDERLPNGLRLVISEDHLVPVVAVSIWYDVGSKHEQPGKNGFAHLFEHVMFHGSRHVAKAEHIALVQAAGGSMNGTTWLDRTNYFETMPSHQLELALWLEADRMGTLLDALNQENLDNQRSVVKNEKRSSYDNRPYGAWFHKLQEHLFPADHPYHHPTIGSMEDLDAASLEDVAGFFRTYYAPNNAVLSVVGDVDPAQVRAWVQRYYGEIPANPSIPPLRDMSLPPVMGAESREVVEDRVPLTRHFFGFRAPRLGDPRFDALEIAAQILAGGKGSRLHRRLVRDERIAQDVG